MKVYVVTLILISPLAGFGATKHFKPKVSRASQVRLSEIISTFDLLSQEDGGLQLEISNVNGQKKSEALSNKTEQYQEYTRYSLDNPFADSDAKLDFYVFEKLKPTLPDDEETADNDTDLSDVRVNLMVLADAATKKTIKSKAQVFYKDSLVAEGSVESNSQIKITDDLSSKIKNCKLRELKVINNLLGSNKRSLYLEARYTHDNKLIKQKLNVSLLNLKQTPIEPPKESTESLDKGTDDVKGIEDETSSNNS